MAPITLRRLVTAQSNRQSEIAGIHKRLSEKPRDSLNIGIIDSRIEALDRIWKEARQANSDIVLREDSEDDPYVLEKHFDTMQDIYEEARDFCLTLRVEFEAPDESNLRDHNNVSLGSDWERENCVANLPRISLPKFSGEYEKWNGFCDLFTTLIHDAPRITDATKLQYLKLCLTDSAADLIKDVATTNANYASTWQALKERYHNPRLIINRHLSSLLDLPQLKQESASGLRSFADEAQRIVRALTNLGLPVEHWDVWLVFIVAERLDPETRKAWELELSDRDQRVLEQEGLEGTRNASDAFPKFAELAKFIVKRAQTLIVTNPERKAEKRPAASVKSYHPRKVFHASSSSSERTSGTAKCPGCSATHWISRCPDFLKKTPQRRRDDIKSLRLCFNCLGRHRVDSCKSAGRCSTCKGKHHSLIHVKSGGEVRALSVPPKGPDDPKRLVLLPTARVLVEDANGGRVFARALLDSGSESSFKTESLAQLLGLSRRRITTPLTGVGDCSAGTAKTEVQFTLRSNRDPSFRLEVNALVLPKLSSRIPTEKPVQFDPSQLAGLISADPEFHSPRKIDLILGSDVLGQLLRPGLRRFPSSSLVAQDTVFGWIISGPVQADCSRRAALCDSQPAKQVAHCTTDGDLDSTLRLFWELEEVPSLHNKLSPDEEACERLFQADHFRDTTGRFVVRLPLKLDLPQAADETRRMALGTLSSMHRRFSRDPKLAQGYRDFMEAYEDLGHMVRIPTSEVQRKDAWYLPHHAVVQSSPTNWKLRVVFDGSRKNRDGQCLNDFLYTGSKLQRDLSLILLNWRRYRFVFTADIVKMFRQIRIREEDQDFQRIVWSPSPEVEPADFRLTTVTYGTNCAPYLAIRTLLQLSEDGKSRFPLGAQCLEEETYVDDSFAGGDTLGAAIQKRVELSELLSAAGIKLDKWAANHSDLLPNQVTQGPPKKIDADTTVKALGVHWNPSQDKFRFTAQDIQDLSAAFTKRSILSNVARLFDPLGWLAPVTVIAKVLLQDLWILKCDWDTPLPTEIRERWYRYCKSLSALSSVSIDRWLGIHPSCTYQIHGFADASSRAYAAAVYIRIDEGNGTYRASLLSAKSKVAPVKTVSIPNLELCGAALLVKLILHVIGLKFLGNAPIFAWSDSQIVLTWLRKHPCHWKTFVANRVAYIQTELHSAIWSHVPTKENPADLATRGVEPSGLAQSKLWWQGPAWLAQPSDLWPRQVKDTRVLHVRAPVVEIDLLDRYSSLDRLIRVVAWCRRPLVSLRRRKDKLEPLPRFLTSSELAEAQIGVIRVAQSTAFPTEIATLTAGKRLPKRHHLGKLNPFVSDADGTLRVGGRLSHSGLPLESRHPPILPQSSALSVLFVRRAHEACLHGGPTLTLSYLMQRVWILGRNRLVKTTIRRCVTCQRVKPKLAQQLMGNLPAERVIPARAFATSGVDYAGPFQIRMAKGRGLRAYKGYVALFVCFTTRAIHLEAVSDLSTEAFIAAFRRFVGRRGICRKLFSDNATNFHGADKELQAMFRRASEFYHKVAPVLANDGTEWTFIPPSTPHYGGLWEAGVKSMKHHLRRVVGEHTLTFEEFSTVLVEIEACLNSRPLSPLSSDIDDLSVLTPSHFLNEGVPSVLPEGDLSEIPENRLRRFQLLQRIRNQFWSRWSSEYLLHLQERERWRDPLVNFGIGQLVLVRDDRYPASKWPMGRVVEVHPGPDNLVRVVTVKTASGSYRRHVARLSPLHFEKASDKR